MELVHFRAIGVGDLATVYSADDRELGRNVALKLFHQPYRTVDIAAELSDIRRQTTLLSQSAHVALIFETGVTTNGRGYVIVEEAAAGSLADQLKHPARVSAEQANATILSAATTLGFSHGLGYVHGSIRPENLLIDADGGVMITDFGFAQVRERLSLNRGDNEHLAPEIIAGERVSSASDIYALASTIYTMVEGRSPLRKSSRELLQTIEGRKLAGEFPREPKKLSGPLRSCVMSALVANPQLRPTARELVARLSSIPTAVFDVQAASAHRNLGPEMAVQFVPYVRQSKVVAPIASIATYGPEAVPRAESQPTLRPKVGSTTPLEVRRRRRAVGVGVVGIAAALTAVAFVVNQSSPDDGAGSRPASSGQAAFVDSTITAASPAAADAAQPSAETTSTVLVASQAPPGDGTGTTIAPAGGPPVPPTSVRPTTTTSTTTNDRSGTSTTVAFVRGAAPATTIFKEQNNDSSGANGLFAPTTSIVAVGVPPTVPAIIPAIVPTTTIRAAVAVAPPPVTASPASTIPPAPPTTAAPSPTTALPAAPRPPTVGSIAVSVLGGGNADFVAASSDRCADSKWQVNGPVSFAQRADWTPAPPGCWNAAHEFDTRWNTYPALVVGHYTVTLTLRKSGLISSNSVGFDVS